MPNNKQSPLVVWESILEYNIQCLRFRTDRQSFMFQQIFIEGQLTMLLATNTITFLQACQYKDRVQKMAEGIMDAGMQGQDRQGLCS